MSFGIDIVGGNYSDVQLMKYIFDTYEIQSEINHGKADNESLGLVDIVGPIIILLPAINETIASLMPAFTAYLNAKKPSGTKQTLELYNGDKKIIITDEKGDLLSFNEISELINKSGIFLN